MEAGSAQEAAEPTLQMLAEIMFADRQMVYEVRGDVDDPPGSSSLV